MATTDAELSRSLRALPRWQRHDDGISRTFQFDDFRAATRFVGRIADAAAARRPLEPRRAPHGHPPAPGGAGRPVATGPLARDARSDG
jgi:hypothetical protein